MWNKIKKLRAPRAARRITCFNHSGVQREDPYFWLREREDPQVLAYLQQENAYQAEVLQHLCGDLPTRLTQEMRARILDQDQTAPYKYGPYQYYDRYEAGADYPIYCRRALDAGPEEVLLDVNQAAKGFEFFDVGGFEVGPCHRLAALAVDTQGRRIYSLSILKLGTQEKPRLIIPDIANNFVWSQDSQSLLYVKQDPDTLRWNRVYRYDLFQDEHCLIFEETDTAFEVSLDLSLSERFVYIECTSTLTTEVWTLPRDNTSSQPVCFLKRQKGHEYYVTDGMDRFFVLSNHQAENFALWQTAIDQTDIQAWQKVIPYDPDVLLEDVDVFQDYLVITQKCEGRSQFKVIDRHTGDIRFIPFDDEVYVVEAGDNFEYTSNEFRFEYESPITPNTIYDHHLQTGAQKLVLQDRVLGGFDSANYDCAYVYAKAEDGTRIPISIVFHKDLRDEHRGNPTLQYGYGAYGIPLEADFDSHLVSLLDRGFVVALCHIRGGSDLGRDWYYQGRKKSKLNTFTDFIACSQFLIQEKWAREDRLYGSGGSAGGLLMGVVANRAPELYHGIYTSVPFVDVVTTMLDESIPLTTGEYDEWGDPNKPEDFHYMLSYSPYDNVRKQSYPHLLVTTGLHDSQVQYWEPAKWIAKLRHTAVDENLLLLKTDMQAGHSGKTGRYNAIGDTALCYAFLICLANQ